MLAPRLAGAPHGRRRLLLAACCAALATGAALAAPPAPAMISNVALRYDTQGRVVNAHDGGIFGPFDGRFFLYGTVYEDCVQAGAVCDGHCGYFGNLFAAYSSVDLANWRLESANVLPELARDNDHVSYWEANVGFNAVTSLYIMTFWSGQYGFKNSSLAVATSASPSGPFVLAPPITLHGATQVSDTVALFVDDDGTAYARFNTQDLPKRHVVERLSSDWLSSTGEFATIFEKATFPWYDGGGMFRRGDDYFVMLSFDCCFCSWGSDALVFVAPSPLGPWRPQAPATAPAPALAPAPASAPARAGSACNLTGSWSGVLAGQPVGPPALHLAQAAGSGAISVSGAVQVDGAYFAANSSVVFPRFPGYAAGALVGAVSAYNGSDDACSQLTWLNYEPPGSFWCKSGACGAAPVPPANWTNEVNFCADGSVPPASVANMYINPCSQDAVFGKNFTIPAQQFSVAVLRNVSTSPAGRPSDTTVLFFGEHFRSAANGLKSHDLQAWVPLAFVDGAGDDPACILPMVWQDTFSLYVWPRAAAASAAETENVVTALEAR